MKLLRLAVFYLNSKQEKWNNFEVKTENCVIRSLQSNIMETSSKQRLIICAEKTLKHKPKISQENIIIPPEKDRRELEKATHFIGNLISISEFVGNSIRSPIPCVVFIPETQDELDFLNNTNGMKFKPIPYVDFKFSLQDIVIEQDLEDRIEGCEFISIALSQSSSLGQLHEYVRFFERAFALASNNLVDSLYSFLKGSDVTYTRNEIYYWIIRLRDGSTHADQRNKFIFEPDMTKHIVRIRQAVYDVLFNKTIWNDSSITRRQVFSTPLGLLEDNTPFGVVGHPKFIGHVQLMDPYDVFPLDLTVKFNSFPENWWFSNADGENIIETQPRPLIVFGKDDKKSINTNNV